MSNFRFKIEAYKGSTITTFNIRNGMGDQQITVMAQTPKELQETLGCLVDLIVGEGLLKTTVRNK